MSYASMQGLSGGPFTTNQSSCGSVTYYPEGRGPDEENGDNGNGDEPVNGNGNGELRFFVLLLGLVAIPIVLDTLLG